jgi:hypothetical protein
VKGIEWQSLFFLKQSIEHAFKKEVASFSHRIYTGMPCKAMLQQATK